MSVHVELRPGESTDRLIKRFFKKCKKVDFMKAYLERVSFFRSPSERKRYKRLKNKHLRELEARRQDRKSKNFTRKY